MCLTFTILGCGSSMGVPRVALGWGSCDPNNPKNRRLRCSLLVERANEAGQVTRVLVDCTPDLRAQLLEAQVDWVDGVLITHEHADHIHGIDDLRPLSFHRPNKIPLYARPEAAEFLRTMFRYIFEADYKFGGLAQVELNPINGPVELFGARFEPVKVIHGDAEIIGFRFGSAAYLTDFSDIPEESFAQLKDLDILFLDALRHKPHPTHSTVDNSLRIVERVNPQRAFFTHICHDLPHEATNAALPPHVRLSYDGMKLEFEI